MTILANNDILAHKKEGNIMPIAKALDVFNKELRKYNKPILTLDYKIDELKKAFYTLAGIYHPDRHV